MANIEKIVLWSGGGGGGGGSLNISYDRIYLQVILINFKNGISFQNELKHSFVYLAIS